MTNPCCGWYAPPRPGPISLWSRRPKRFATEFLTFRKFARYFSGCGFWVTPSVSGRIVDAFRPRMGYIVSMIRRLAPLVLILTSCNAPPPGVQQQGMAQELVGRVAGAPEHCVSIMPEQSLRVAEGDRHVLVYGNGRTIWAN